MKKWFAEVPDCWKSKPGKIMGPCHHFDVVFVPKPCAKKMGQGTEKETRDEKG